MSSERIRSFIAVDLDDDVIREKIARTQRDLEQTGAQLKIVDPRIIHFTLRFLGEVPQTTIEIVKEAMSSVMFERFDVVLCGIGAFPNLRRINVIWIGVTQGEDRLDEIFQKMEPRLRKIGFAQDAKGFNPHLTIARVKSALNREPLAGYLSKSEKTEFGKFSVTSIRLKKSTLTPSGPIYTTIHEITAS